MDRRDTLKAGAFFALSSLIGAGLSTTAHAGPKAEDKPSAGGQLRMALVTATVVRRNGRRGILSVESTLEIADGALMDRAKLSQPRLNAAFNEAIQAEAMRTLPNAVPDLNAITRTLQRATDRVLGREGAKVLLGTVMMT